MVVIRRLVDRQRAYTGIFLRGEPAQIFPTTDYEHARILSIFKQDRPHDGIHNDFSDYASPEAMQALKAKVAALPTEIPSMAAPNAEVVSPPDRTKEPPLFLTIYRPPAT